MLLADHAQAADGKLNVIGGGWSVIGPEPAPFALAMIIQVPWDQIDTGHKLRLELIDADGRPVMTEMPDGPQPISIEADFEVGRPPGLQPGLPCEIPLAINLGPQPIPAGGRYEWRLWIDGDTAEDWRLTFSTRPA